MENDNLWVLQQMLDPDNTGSVNAAPVTIIYEEIVFSNAKFTFNDKVQEIAGAL